MLPRICVSTCGSRGFQRLPGGIARDLPVMSCTSSQSTNRRFSIGKYRRMTYLQDPFGLLVRPLPHYFTIECQICKVVSISHFVLSDCSICPSPTALSISTSLEVSLPCSAPRTILPIPKPPNISATSFSSRSCHLIYLSRRISPLWNAERLRATLTGIRYASSQRIGKTALPCYDSSTTAV